MLHNEARELLVQGYEATHDAKGIAKAYSVSKWTVYRLAEQKRKTGSVALRTSQRGRKPVLTALTGLVGGVFVFLTDYDGPPEGGSDGERDVFDALSCSHGAVGGVGLRQPVSGHLRPLETRGPGKAQAPPQRHLQQISPSRRCDQLFDRACPFLYPTLALSAVTQSPEHTAPGFAVCAYPTRSKTSSSRMVRSSKRLRRSSAASAARRLQSHSGLPASTSR